MKARGVAFAIESLSRLTELESNGEPIIAQEEAEEIFVRLERVVLAKIDEFIPHYLIKVLTAFASAGYGSGELYDVLVHKIIEACLPQYDRYGDLKKDQPTVKYSDMIRFFEVFPDVTYIYEAAMSE